MMSTWRCCVYERHPADLLYSREIVSNLPRRCVSKKPNKDELRQRLLERQNTQRQYHDQHARDLPPLGVGQPVHVQHPITGKWSPAQVAAKSMEPRSYIVETSDQTRIRRNRRHLRESATVATPADVSINRSPVNDRARVRDIGDQANSTAPSVEQPKTVQQDTPVAPPEVKTITRSGRTVHAPKKYELHLFSFKSKS